MSMVLSVRRYGLRNFSMSKSKSVLVEKTINQSSKSGRKFSTRLMRGIISSSPIAFYLLSQQSCMCAGDSDIPKPDGDAKPDPVERLIASTFPIVAPLGFGGIFGFTAGYAMRKVGEKAAYVVGLTFIGLQGLAYCGYIKVDYFKVSDDAKKAIDADGDGKITSNDFIVIWRKLKDILGSQLPSAGGFSAGFAMGLYYG